MRYYSITITDPATGNVIRPRIFQPLKLPDTYTSYVNGKTLPGALDIEIQAVAYPYAVPKQGSFIRIWGISLQEISNGTDLNGKDIIVKAGMQKGLPLARPSQNGVILQGSIFQCNGNWIGTDKTLDIMLLPTEAKPKNFAFNWPKNTPLADAIKATLGTALPNLDPKISISGDLKLPGNMVGSYAKLEDFAQAIKRVSNLPAFAGIKTLSGAKYSGVDITVKEKTVLVYDGTADYAANSYSNPKKIDFIDLIGQPTWLNATKINFKCVMRADISVGDYVSLPTSLAPPYVLTTQGSALPNTPARDKLTFKGGKFVVQNVYHWGRYRQPSAEAWCTTYDAVFAPEPNAGS